MAETTIRQAPMGGVTMPMVRFRQTTMPKWIGSMPWAAAAGPNRGTSSARAMGTSMIMPARRKIPFARSRNQVPVRPDSVTSIPMRWGHCSRLAIHPKQAAAVRMMKMVPVSMAAF